MSNTASIPDTESVLSEDELLRMHAYWRACNYLAVGMIYLQDNPLLRRPLEADHTKRRLLGHWGASPGLSFTYVHMNRLINKYDLNAIFLAGPGHGAPREEIRADPRRPPAHGLGCLPAGRPGAGRGGDYA